ncbi:hypothetical protein Metlim_1086 [Methanoplanus limicola DSM 2279]|uniref:Uncharacterized protein n=1 Tax=Methanoplanus limicola DSM 2279 TaxID=937775 RepID=H1YZZ3_9EURY|nr:hypothetical protein Metlim_1086 [Methanoplanus limicola DSM 2279]
MSWDENYGDLELYVYRPDDTLIGIIQIYMTVQKRTA